MSTDSVSPLRQRMIEDMNARKLGVHSRFIGQWLQERLGQTFVIKNRPGAATNIATEMVVRAPPMAIRCRAMSRRNTKLSLP